MEDNFLLNNLYINRITITKEIPEWNYLRNLPVVKCLKEMDGIRLSKNVTFLVGENGVGKSTLIEGIAVAMGFNPEGGTINFNFATEATHSDLHKYLTVSRGYKRQRDGYFLRAESFYNAATYIDEIDRDPYPIAKVIGSYGGKSLHKQSHGESFMSLVEHRFGGNGLYILDEPEAALSPMRLMRLMYRMQELVEKNSQFIISTHSPILMTFPGAEVLEITGSGITSVDYRDTEHYIVTKRFMDAPDRILESLLGDGKED